MGKKRIRIDWGQCPRCKSHKVEPSGEMRENKQQWHCKYCRLVWDVVFRPVEIYAEGTKWDINENSEAPDTVNIIWYEVRSRTPSRLLACSQCGQGFERLYTMAQNPEEAITDPAAACWEHSGIEEVIRIEQELYIRPRDIENVFPVVWR